MRDGSGAAEPPPRQGLTFIRVLQLAHAIKDGSPLATNDAELLELCRAWLRLTDIDPLWTERALRNDAHREADPNPQGGSDNG
jgi:hypothetical protein